MAVSSFAGRTRPVRQLPEPARFWIAYSPRKWRSSSFLWTDLANARLGGLDRHPVQPLTEFEWEELDDLFYLPPVGPGLVRARNRLAASLIEAGTPVLLQLLPGDPVPLPAATVVYDLLEPLLEGQVERLAVLPPGSNAVWPLIPGLTEPRELCEEGCAILAAAGVRSVQPLAVEMTPLARRRLAEGNDEEVFEALFHGEPPSERTFARIAVRHGLEVFLRRPKTGHSVRQQSNRFIAAQLALAGELWLRLEKSVSFGQALFRAARGAEITHYHLAALVHEQNLKVMDWLDASTVELVKEIVDKGMPTLLESLLAEYLGTRKPPRARRSAQAAQPSGSSL